MFKTSRNKDKKRHIGLGLIMSLLCIVSLFAGSVQAESKTAPPPYDKEGSITVSIKANNTPVPGGNMTIYKVADVVSDNGYRFAYTDAFKNFAAENSDYKSDYNSAYIPEDVFPDAFTSKKTEEESLRANLNANYDMAMNLMTYVHTNKIDAPEPANLGTAGSAVFDKLTAGLYLFIQEVPADGYYAVTPFLVTLPGVEANGELKWELNANPKPETHAREGEPAPVSVDPLISKSVVKYSGGESTALKNKDLPSGTYFDFKFEAKKSSYPMPDNEDGSVVSRKGTTMQLRVNGIDTIEIGKITFDKEGEYYYTVEELAPENASFSRDTRVYSLAYFVTKSADGSKLEVRGEVRDGNSNGKLLEEKANPTLGFTNIYTPPTGVTPTTPPGKVVPPPDVTKTPITASGGKLPQTGQLWWPIWLLSAVGIALIVGGIIMKSHSKKA